MSNLLGRAGFTLLTVDVDEVKVMYPSMWELLEDVQAMGENNAVIERYVLSPCHRDLLQAWSPCPLHSTDGHICTEIP